MCEKGNLYFGSICTHTHVNILVAFFTVAWISKELFIDIITGSPNAQVLFCLLSSVVVVCNTAW